MARFIVACVLVAGLCTAGMVVLGQNLWEGPEKKDKEKVAAKKDKDVKLPDDVEKAPKADGGKPLETKATPRLSSGDDTGRARVTEVVGGAGAAPLVLTDARIVPSEQQNVPAQRDGQLLFLATEVEPGESVPAEKRFMYETTQVLVRVKDAREWADVPESQKVFVRAADGSFLNYRPARDTDDLMDPETLLQPRQVVYRTLDVGDRVKAGQMLGLINPVLALAEVKKQQAKVVASAADVRASNGLYEESLRRYQRDRKLGRVVSPDELEISRVTAEKYKEETEAKREAVKMAQSELAATYTILRQHVVRATVPGVIRQTFKQRGEAVKNLENVLRLQNPNLLQVDAQVDVQEALVLRGRMAEAEGHRAEAMKIWRKALAKDPKAAEPDEAKKLRERADRLTFVEVEASRQEPPVAALAGHTGEVMCVAVTREKDPRVVSGSEDGTVRVWARVAGEDRWGEQKVLTLGAVVRSLAVTGPKADANRMFVGTATGRGRLFDLDDLSAGEVMLESRHTGPITSAAFNAEGTMCVTGGTDSHLCLWDAKTGKLLGRVPNAHRAAVTSVTFTAKGQVVSAGQDKRLTVWNLAEGGEGGKTLKRDGVPMERRGGGEVGLLGADPTGEYVLLDEGRDLRVQSLTGETYLGTLRNPAGTPGFGYFALFSPDGNTILTGGNAAGRVQLWRAPSAKARPSEMRQYLWSGTATCAAFDPSGAFAVTGTEDRRVLVWKMPDPKEAQEPLPGQLTFVEEFLDTAARKLAVKADVRNPGWVIPGATATVVVPALKK